MVSDSLNSAADKRKKSTGHETQEFAQSILDALDSHIAVLNEKGEIIAVNDAWKCFAENNEGTPISCDVGINYLEVCDAAIGAWAEEAPIVANAIRKIITGDQTEFSLEYPCHSSSQERWFKICIKHFDDKRSTKLVVAHENITQRKKHEKELERTNRLYSSLSHINQAIVRMTSRDDFFRQVCQFLVQEGGFSLAWIGWHDPETHRIMPIAQWGDEKGSLKRVRIYTDSRPEGLGPGGTAFREGKPYICNNFFLDPTTELWREEARKQNINAVAVFPIRSNGETCGTFTVYAKEPEFFQDREVALLNEVASNVSFALDNFQREQERQQSQVELQRMQEKLELRVKQRTAELERANSSLQIEIAERKQSEAKTLIRTRQLETVAILGQQALTNVDIDSLMQNITDYVTTTMGVEKSSLWEFVPDAEFLRFRAGTGWETDVSSFILTNSNDSHAGYALSQDAPLIITDLNRETRFQPPAFLLKEGVKSGVIVVIGGGKTPFGTLGAYTAKSRQFTRDDVYIMQNMAHVLSTTLEQRRISSEIIQLNANLQEMNQELSIRNAQRQITMDALQEAAEVLEQAKAEADEAREYAETANRSKNEFLSRMSHELRTPLNAILGFSQILEDQELTALQQESVKYILKGGRHLLNLINDVLDIARIEAGRFELSIESIALDDIIPEACALVRPLASEHNIQLQLNSLSSANCHVTADRRQLKQVLINLLSNAIKYNQPQGKVIVSWESVNDEKTRISVQDTGYGIAQEDLSKLFTPFERLDAGNSDVEGTGLGLALSQRLLTAMDSELRAESTLGEGSTFFFELQSAMAPEDVMITSSKTSLSNNSDSASEEEYTLLLIEDNASNLRLIEMILANRPEITLHSAIQGSVGLDLARQHEPDMILLDLHLPDMSGQQILNQLKRSAITRDIPVIVISADATPSRVQKLLNQGVAAYLTKPLDVVEFLQILDKTLQPKIARTHEPNNEENSI
jgi:signal transduction histidine kinase/ActR/RegA family two-component response regulator